MPSRWISSIINRSALSEFNLLIVNPPNLSKKHFTYCNFSLMIFSLFNLYSIGETNTFNWPAFYYLCYSPIRVTSKTAYFYNEISTSSWAFPTKSSKIKSLSIIENYNDLDANSPTFQNILYFPIPSYVVNEFLFIVKSLIST